MSETKHSPEPWVYFDNGFDAGIASEANVRAAHAKGHQHPSLIFGGEPSEGRIEADDPNMRRVVACVNACAGIPTAVLERLRDGELRHGLIAIEERTGLRFGLEEG